MINGVKADLGLISTLECWNRKEVTRSAFNLRLDIKGPWATLWGSPCQHSPEQVALAVADHWQVDVARSTIGFFGDADTVRPDEASTIWWWRIDAPNTLRWQDGASPW